MFYGNLSVIDLNIFHTNPPFIEGVPPLYPAPNKPPVGFIGAGVPPHPPRLEERRLVFLRLPPLHFLDFLDFLDFLRLPPYPKFF